MRQPRLHLLHTLLLLIPASVGLTLGTCAQAARHLPAPGSRGVAIADPAIPRPATKPCVVEIFAPRDFGAQGSNTRMDAHPDAFAYRPPAKCPGPWAKVVLVADFSVDAGRQYDRTASIWLDGVNLYFGTTQEPSAHTAPHWQVQRDLTDYSALLHAAGSGKVLINNWVSGDRRSVIHASARLLFYPANVAFPAPRVPDVVDALNHADQLPASLKTPRDTLTRRLVFPRNTARVYLDVFAQAQSSDEFYYTCLKDSLIQSGKTHRKHDKAAPQKPDTCGGGNFREVEVSIDGQPAGLAPVTPWVFTGGIDPYLWRPTPGAGTLNFRPYRIDLTPFAGLLSDGRPHTVSVRVLGAHDYFAVAAAVLVYRDAHLTHTGGAITRNTLQGLNPAPIVTSTLGTIPGPGVNGDALTQSRHHYVIEGYIDTTHGKLRTRVTSTLVFRNVQHYRTDSHGNLHETARQSTRTITRMDSHGGTRAQHRHRFQANDFTLNLYNLMRPGKGKTQDMLTDITQDFTRHIEQQQGNFLLYTASMRNHHAGADRFIYNPADIHSFRHLGQNSTQTFTFRNSLGDCYQTQVQSRDDKVSHVATGQGCYANRNTLHWFVRADGFPDSFGWRNTAHQRQP